MGQFPEREYGMGSSGEVSGVPKVEPLDKSDETVCPNCGCKQLFSVEVPMKNALLKGGGGVGHYIGCAACPWASPCVVAATGREI